MIRNERSPGHTNNSRSRDRSSVIGRPDTIRGLYEQRGGDGDDVRIVDVTGLQSGALPDAVHSPVGERRGTIVLLAGSGESGGQFGFVIDELTRDGFSVSVFDDVSIDLPAAQVGAVQELQRPGAVAPFMVIGTGIGAALAANIARNESLGVTAIVLVGVHAQSLRPVRRVRTPSFATASANALEEVDPATMLPPAGRLYTPTLVFHGNADEITDAADVVTWAAELPFGAVRIVRDGGHRLLSGEARWTVAASIVLFIERHRAGQPILLEAFTH